MGTPQGPSWGQWGPIWSKKQVNTIKKYHASKFEFSTTLRSSISTKIRLYGYGAKSRWGPPRVHLVANGVLFGSKKWIKTINNYHARNSNFHLHRSHRFRPKFEFRVMAPNQGWDPLGSILGPLGSHGSKKWVKTVKNYHAPEFKISTKQRSLISAKIRLYPLFYPMGSHWVQKMCQNRKKLPCPKIQIFEYTAVIDFGQI